MKVVTVEMYDNLFAEECPVCGGIIGYHINSYGQVVKQCNRCKHIITDDVVTTDKTTITDYNQSTTTSSTPISNSSYIKDYGFGNIVVDKDNYYRHYRICPDSNLKPNELSILCNLIKIKCGEIEINFDTNRDLKHIGSIVINGIKFKKVEE